jgi:hypothetical protein
MDTSAGGGAVCAGLSATTRAAGAAVSAGRTAGPLSETTTRPTRAAATSGSTTSALTSGGALCCLGRIGAEGVGSERDAPSGNVQTAARTDPARTAGTAEPSATAASPVSSVSARGDCMVIKAARAPSTAAPTAASIGSSTSEGSGTSDCAIGFER